MTLAAVLKLERDILATPIKTATLVQRTYACWRSAIGRVQDAVANDSDHSGLVF